MKAGVAQVVSVISAKAEVQGKRVSLGSAQQIPLSKLRDDLQLAYAGHGNVGQVQTLSGGIGVMPSLSSPQQPIRRNILLSGFWQAMFSPIFELIGQIQPRWPFGLVTSSGRVRLCTGAIGRIVSKL